MFLSKFRKLFLASLCLTLSFHGISSATTVSVSADFSSSPEMQKVIQSIGKINPAVHLAIGDFSYGNNADPLQEQTWCNLVKTQLGTQGIDTASFPFQLLSGNHEDSDPLEGNNGYIMDFASCLPDQMSSTGTYAAHYYFDLDNARIIMTSPDLFIDGKSYTYTSASPEYADVSDWIDAGRTAGKEWIIVATHKNCLNIGIKPSCEIGTDLMNMLIEKQVDLVVQGHEHNYQRAKQLKLSPECPSLVIDSFDPACTVNPNSNTLYRKGEGTVVIVVGTGGKELRKIRTDDPEVGYFLRAMGSNMEPSYGNLVLDFSGKTLQGSFVPATGTFSDKFVISDTLTHLYAPHIETNLSGDFNGDGKDGTAILSANGTTATWRVAKSTGSSFESLGTWANDFGNEGDQFFVGDFTGDGKDDIARSRLMGSTLMEWRVAKSNGSRFKDLNNWNQSMQTPSDQVVIGDTNGDKIDDIVFTRLLDVSTLEVWNAPSNGRSFEQPIRVSADFGRDTYDFRLADFNGDGSEEIARVKSLSTTVQAWDMAPFSDTSLQATVPLSADLGDPGNLY